MDYLENAEAQGNSHIACHYADAPKFTGEKTQ